MGPGLDRRFPRSFAADAAVPSSPEAQKRYFFDLNERLIVQSDDFFGYRTPTDFRLEQRPIRVHGTGSHANPAVDDAKYAGQFGNFLRFTSPVRSPYPENDLVNARWFPVVPKEGKPKRAIIVIPQWNGDALSHNAFNRLFRLFGVSTLRLSMPYHDIRMPSELHRADYSVSANIGRTIHAARQGIIDIRCCVDWLEQQGYTEFGVLGTSLGSCYAFIASPMTPASGSTSSTTPPPSSATSSGPASPPATSAPASSRCSTPTNSATPTPASVPSPTSTSSSAGPSTCS